jgi:hypothetical protein
MSIKQCWSGRCELFLIRGIFGEKTNSEVGAIPRSDENQFRSALAIIPTSIDKAQIQDTRK